MMRLQVGDQSRALDLLGQLMLKENGTTHYETFRWATWVYCCKVRRTLKHARTSALICPAAAFLHAHHLSTPTLP